MNEIHHNYDLYPSKQKNNEKKKFSNKKLTMKSKKANQNQPSTHYFINTQSNKMIDNNNDLNSDKKINFNNNGSIKKNRNISNIYPKTQNSGKNIDQNILEIADGFLNSPIIRNLSPQKTQKTENGIDNSNFINKNFLLNGKNKEIGLLFYLFIWERYY